MTAVRSTTEVHHRDGYAHLAPTLAEYAVTAAADPRRRELRDELAVALWPVVAHIARRYHDRGEPVEDLEQIGAIGLLKALERFDPARGTDILSYAVPTITGEIRRHFRDRTWAMRVPRSLKDLQVPMREAVGELTTTLRRSPRPSEIAGHLGVPVEQVLDALNAAQAYTADSLDTLISPTDDGHLALGDLLAAADQDPSAIAYRHELRAALAELPERERTIVVLRFFHDMTQTQIAQRVGLSQMHVSRLLSHTLTRLRTHLDAP